MMIEYCAQTSTAQTESVIISGDEGIEDVEMSLVGLIPFKDCIIGFGDSKSSIDLGLGSMTEESGREVQKVFMHDNFIMVTHGCNEFKEISTDNTIWLETWIKAHIGEVSNYYEFLNLLQGDLAAHQNEGEYKFIIGSKDRNGIYIRDAGIFNHNIQLLPQKRDYRNILYAGAPFYQTAINAVNNYVHSYVGNDEECKNGIQQLIEEQIDIADKTHEEYNPVGKPVNVEIWRPR